MPIMLEKVPSRPKATQLDILDTGELFTSPYKEGNVYMKTDSAAHGEVAIWNFTENRKEYMMPTIWVIPLTGELKYWKA